MILATLLLTALPTQADDAKTDTQARKAPEKEVAAEPVKIAGLTFQVPKAWKAVRPQSQMRAVQYDIPLAEGDEGKSEAYAFTGIGGTAEANIKRWVGQFVKLDGKEKTEEFTVDGVKVTLVEIHGTFNDAPMMAPGNAVKRDDFAMLGAVVEDPKQSTPIFFKFLAPKKTAEAQKAGFEQMFRKMSR